MAAESPLSVAAGIGDKLTDYTIQSKLQSQDNQNYRQNQRMLFEMAQDAQKQSASNMVEGLTRAGLSPALASPAGLTPAGMSSAPMHNTHANPSSLDPVSAVLASKQAKLMDAEIDKMNEETRGENILNNREQQADEMFRDAIAENMEDLIHIYKANGFDTSSLEASYDRLLESDVNLGTFKANMSAMEMSSKNLSAYLDKLKSVVDQQTELAKMENGAAASLAKMPHLEREFMEKRIALSLAEQFYMISSGKLAKQKINELGVEMEKMKSEMKLMVKQGKLTDVQANQIMNNDISTLIDTGEYKKALVATGVEGGKSFIHGFGAGSGFAVGAAATGGRGAVGGAALATKQAAKNVVSPLKRFSKNLPEISTKTVGHYGKPMKNYLGDLDKKLLEARKPKIKPKRK